jgi:sulfoxide reductase heme-binding subunit YedZ
VLGFKQLWTGLGVVGGWLAAILGISYYVRHWIGAATWRKLHRWTLLAYVLALAHTIGSGTDAASSWMLAILAAAVVPALALSLKRVGERSGNHLDPRSPSPV